MQLNGKCHDNVNDSFYFKLKIMCLLQLSDTNIRKQFGKKVL